MGRGAGGVVGTGHYGQLSGGFLGLWSWHGFVFRYLVIGAHSLVT